MSQSTTPPSPGTAPHYDRKCETCGSARAWFGYDLGRGGVAWFCAEHRDDGEALFAPLLRARARAARD